MLTAAREAATTENEGEDQSKELVFFSHPGVFKTTLVMPVAELLSRSSDIDFFLDEWCIQTSERGWTKILSELTRCTIFVVFIDHCHFVSSEYCLSELELALELGKTILPVFLSSLRDYPKKAEQVQYSPDGWTNERVANLVSAVTQINGVRSYDDKKFSSNDLVREITQIAAKQQTQIIRFEQNKTYSACGKSSIAGRLLPRLSASFFGLKIIRFRNTLQHTIFLWVYHLPNQLILEQYSAERAGGVSLPLGALRANNPVAGGVQSVRVIKGVKMPIYLEHDTALISFAVQEPDRPGYLLLQHNRRVPKNHTFIFRDYHVLHPLIRISSLPSQSQPGA